MNNASVGAFVDISFEIVSDAPSGPQSIHFDTKIHYIDKGEGVPILLVHGIGQSLFTWRNNIDYFAENGYRVIAFDLAGFGYSDHPHIYYTVEEYALIIDALLDALNIKKVHVFGFSTGALSAICFAHNCPRKADKLVLISPGGPNENYPFSMKFLTMWIGHAISRLFFSEVTLRNILHDLFFDKPQVTNEVVDGYHDPYKDKDVRETLAMCMAHFDDTHTRSLLKGTKNSVLVFSGEDDKIHNEKTIRAYAQNIPGVRHIRIRNCGHFVHEEKPNRFNEEALGFLRVGEDGQHII